MSSIQLPCPSCGQTLQLPAEADGKTARCPACETIFQVDARSAGVVESPPSSNPDSPALGAGGSPYSAPPVSGGYDGAGANPINPYQPSVGPDEPRLSGPIKIGQVSVDAVWNLGFEILKVRWGVLLLAGVITTALSFGLQFFGNVLPAVMQAAMGEVGAIIGTVVSFVVSFGASLLINLGMINFSFAVARNKPTPLGDLVPPMGALGKLLVGMLAIFLAVVVVGGVIGGVVFGISQINEAAAAVLGIVAVVIAVVIYLIGIWLLWSWPAVCIDGRTDAIGAMRTAMMITSENRLTSFVLLLIAMGLGVLGVLMCCIGTLVTTPFTALLFGVAYLMITGQAVSDPRDAVAYPTFSPDGRQTYGNP